MYRLFTASDQRKREILLDVANKTDNCKVSPRHYHRLVHELNQDLQAIGFHYEIDPYTKNWKDIPLPHYQLRIIQSQLADFYGKNSESFMVFKLIFESYLKNEPITVQDCAKTLYISSKAVYRAIQKFNDIHHEVHFSLILEHKRIVVQGNLFNVYYHFTAYYNYYYKFTGNSLELNATTIQFIPFGEHCQTVISDSLRDCLDPIFSPLKPKTYLPTIVCLFFEQKSKDTRFLMKKIDQEVHAHDLFLHDFLGKFYDALIDTIELRPKAEQMAIMFITYELRHEIYFKPTLISEDSNKVTRIQRIKFFTENFIKDNNGKYRNLIDDDFIELIYYLEPYYSRKTKPLRICIKFSESLSAGPYFQKELRHIYNNTIIIFVYNPLYCDVLITDIPDLKHPNKIFISPVNVFTQDDRISIHHQIVESILKVNSDQ
ncbi:helix-turn-helix domain-containing protein [Erysipelothrix tonsillarum]|uniref:helix-turn-helix domain-containing protein n=1 Tax=Erysipelothrix tonsillarum TaxID=38402 RepID=UPI0003755328|nr:helix-turn-helix domain-containing protein [Erysipelothrix tonsillarum]